MRSHESGFLSEATRPCEGKSELLQQAITIRPFATLDEMRVCEQLQHAVWQYAEIEIVPGNVFVVAQKTGGEVLGAFDADRAIGFALAFPAFRFPRFYLHSHMTAVLPEYQNQGIGRSLKLAQREHALARGIDLIEWTFDPLQLKNAHFNIARLGAIARRYLPDFYGSTSSHLHSGLPTDRLVAEWRLDSTGVANALEGKHRQLPATHQRISVPANISDMCRSDPHRAAEIQSRIQREFQQLFQNSYAVTGFSLENGYGTYLLETYED